MAQDLGNGSELAKPSLRLMAPTLWFGSSDVKGVKQRPTQEIDNEASQYRAIRRVWSAQTEKSPWAGNHRGARAVRTTHADGADNAPRGATKFHAQTH